MVVHWFAIIAAVFMLAALVMWFRAFIIGAMLPTFQRDLSLVMLLLIAGGLFLAFDVIYIH